MASHQFLLYTSAAKVCNRMFLLFDSLEFTTNMYNCIYSWTVNLGQAIGQLWGLCAPISIIVQL